MKWHAKEFRFETRGITRFLVPLEVRIEQWLNAFDEISHRTVKVTSTDVGVLVVVYGKL